MKKKYFITFLVSLLIQLFLLNSSFAQTDSLNDFLEKRKKEVQPFTSNDVRIDLESLGLDDVEKNNQESTKKSAVTTNENNNLQLKTIINNSNQQLIENNINQNPNLTENSNQKINKKYPSKTIKKNNLKNQIIDQSQITDVPQSSNQKNKINNQIQRINNQKKQQLSSRLKQEAIKSKELYKKPIETQENDVIKSQIIDDFFNQEEQSNLSENNFYKDSLTQEKLIKIEIEPKVSSQELKNKKQILNYLRRLYLGQENDPKIERLKIIDIDFNDDETIIPKPKNLNRFMQDELPAYPILSPLRNQDNFHIPSVISPKQKIDILFQTINNGDIQSFIEIFKQIKNPNIQNNFGDTIITKSIILKRHDILAEILMKGADPDLPNRLGYTPLEIAIELLDFRAMQILIENRANINSIDRFGRTYLMHASRVGLLPAVDLLVKNNADINATDNDGFSALSIAYRHKKEIIVQYLLKNGAKQWIEKKNIPSQQKLILELQDRWKR